MGLCDLPEGQPLGEGGSAGPRLPPGGLLPSVVKQFRVLDSNWVNEP